MRVDVFLHREGESQYWVGPRISGMGWVVELDLGIVMLYHLAAPLLQKNAGLSK